MLVPPPHAVAPASSRSYTKCGWIQKVCVTVFDISPSQAHFWRQVDCFKHRATQNFVSSLDFFCQETGASLPSRRALCRLSLSVSSNASGMSLAITIAARQSAKPALVRFFHIASATSPTKILRILLISGSHAGGLLACKLVAVPQLLSLFNSQVPRRSFCPWTPLGTSPYGLWGKAGWATLSVPDHQLPVESADSGKNYRWNLSARRIQAGHILQFATSIYLHTLYICLTWPIYVHIKSYKLVYTYINVYL